MEAGTKSFRFQATGSRLGQPWWLHSVMEPILHTWHQVMHLGSRAASGWTLPFRVHSLDGETGMETDKNSIGS